MNSIPSDWAVTVEQEMKSFAQVYGTHYSMTKRELFAFFEIGCFLNLVKLYKQNGCTVTPQNLCDDAYKYLTTPSGNPHNFSYISIKLGGKEFELRQQVRVVSHLNKDIAFTPDILVVKAGAEILDDTDKDYANGKRRFFRVSSKDVIAAHECKSLSPFPELLVSFIGALMAGHEWVNSPDWKDWVNKDALHLAPTLFAGGPARPLQKRMITALQTEFPMNVIVGLHSGITSLKGKATVYVDPEI